jgi:PIN domain nuclease of toxin-antitoxin system
MKLLIDTHVFVWATVQPNLLSSRAGAALEDVDNEILLSTVSAYEIELKRDRDPVLQRIPADLDLAASAQQIYWLGVSQEHAATAGRLARLHAIHLTGSSSHRPLSSRRHWSAETAGSPPTAFR